MAISRRSGSLRCGFAAVQILAKRFRKAIFPTGAGFWAAGRFARGVFFTHGH